MRVRMPPPLTVIYPLKPYGSKWDDWELRLSLRSLAQNLVCDYRVYILTEERTAPRWLAREEVEIVDAGPYKSVLREAARLPGEQYLWMNDDILLLRPETPYTLRTPLTCGTLPKRRNPDHAWQRRRYHVAAWLRENGFPATDFSTHTPYLYDAGQFRETLEVAETIGGAWGCKIPFESLHFNLHRISGDPCAGQKSAFQKDRALDETIAARRFLNHFPAALDGKSLRLRGYLRGLFGHASRFEVLERKLQQAPQQIPVLIHVPKTGGTSLTEWLPSENTLTAREYGAYGLTDHHPISARPRALENRPFAFVRHPEARAISIWAHFNRRMKRKNPQNLWLENIVQNVHSGDLNEFWENADIAFLSGGMIHLKPQVFFIDGACELYDFAHFEEGALHVGARCGASGSLPHSMKSKRPSVPLSGRSIARIREFYAADYPLYERAQKQWLERDYC